MRKHILQDTLEQDGKLLCDVIIIHGKPINPCICNQDRMETLGLDVPLLDPTGDFSGPRAQASSNDSKCTKTTIKRPRQQPVQHRSSQRDSVSFAQGSSHQPSAWTGELPLTIRSGKREHHRPIITTDQLQQHIWDEHVRKLGSGRTSLECRILLERCITTN